MPTWSMLDPGLGRELRQLGQLTTQKRDANHNHLDETEPGNGAQTAVAQTTHDAGWRMKAMTTRMTRDVERETQAVATWTTHDAGWKARATQHRRRAPHNRDANAA